MRVPRSLLVVFALSACGDDPVELGEVPSTVVCVRGGLAAGAACDDEGQWCASTNQCGLDVTYCKCVDGAYACTEPFTAEEIAACDVVPGASCVLEGTGVCDQEPAGGGQCACQDGAWSCVRSCDNCPTTQPADGDACAIANGCRYAGLADDVHVHWRRVRVRLTAGAQGAS